MMLGQISNARLLEGRCLANGVAESLGSWPQREFLLLALLAAETKYERHPNAGPHLR